MKKKGSILAIKVIVFLVGFCFIFLGLQKVLHYRWVQKEDIYSTNIFIKNLPEDTYDVLFFGTSETKFSVFPAVMYQETGLTSFNYAVTYESPITLYYQIEYALRYLDPEVVVCDFSALLDDCDPERGDGVYRKVVETMPDKDIKWELIKSIKQEFPEQSVLSYLFPMLRYHDMWSELTELDFEKDYVYNPDYPGYTGGCELSRDEFEVEEIELTPDLWVHDTVDAEFSERSLYWYEKIINLCHENDVKVAAFYPTAYGLAYDHIRNLSDILVFLEPKGVKVIDFNNYESVERLGIELTEDFVEETHMTYRGSLKTSKALAHEIMDFYELPDHRGEESAIDWEGHWDTFCEIYGVENTY